MFAVQRRRTPDVIAGGAHEDTHLAMSFFVRMPFRPLPLSSELLVTRSIFDMMFTQETSKLTMADIALRTPLYIGKCSHQIIGWFHLIIAVYVSEEPT